VTCVESPVVSAIFDDFTISSCAKRIVHHIYTPGTHHTPTACTNPSTVSLCKRNWGPSSEMSKNHTSKHFQKEAATARGSRVRLTRRDPPVHTSGNTQPGATQRPYSLVFSRRFAVVHLPTCFTHGDISVATPRLAGARYRGCLNTQIKVASLIYI
jgi:hypothetical protein